jgi:hypothetical protein
MKRDIFYFSVLLVFLNFFCLQAFSQTEIPVREERVTKPPAEVVHKLDLGFGLGIDYGGLLGIQFGFAPIQHLTVFATGGYYVLGFGWQIGLKGLFIPKTDKHVARPFLKAMYGTHSAILVDGTTEYDKIYTGFTIGAGLELRFGKKKQNGLDIDLNIPLRTIDYWDDFNTLKNDPDYEVTQEPFPVTFSVGFHHEF